MIMKKEIIVTQQNSSEVVELIAASLPKNKKVLIRNAYVGSQDEALTLLKKHKNYEGFVMSNGQTQLSVQHSNYFKEGSVKMDYHHTRDGNTLLIILAGSHPCVTLVRPSDKVIILSEAIFILKNGTDSISEKKPYIKALEFNR